MKVANIAAAKTHFSRLIEQVKRGETVLITERNQPVARLEGVTAAPDLAGLYATGLLTAPSQPLDLAAFLSAPRAGLAPHQSLAAAVLAEREEER